MLQRIYRRTWTTCWFALAAVIVSAAVAMNVARLFLPMVAERYSDTIEKRVSVLLGQPVKIGGLDAAWYKFGPRLVLNDVSLLDQPNGNTIAHFNKTGLGFDLFSYLRYGRLGLNSVAISGVNLYVQRHADGGISIAGIDTQASGSQAVAGGALERWIFGQVQLDIKDTNIYWRDFTLENEILHFSNVNFRLRNKGGKHQLSGSVNLPVLFGERFSFAMEVTGDPLKPVGWTGTLYVKGRGIDFAKILSGRSMQEMQLKSGNSDFRLWSKWRNGKLLQLSGEIDAHNLQLKRLTSDQQNREVSIANIAGKILWQRRGRGWRMKVTDFIMARSEASWPKTQISLTSNSAHLFQNADIEAKFSFLRIEDLSAILLASPQSNKEMSAMLDQLQPAGDLYNVHLRFTQQNENQAKYYIQTEFSDFNIAPWQKLPGIINLNGHLHASESTGYLHLDTRDTQFNMPKQFRETIIIDEASGRIDWNYRPGVWQVTARQFMVKNEDLATRTNLDLNIPVDGSSPFLDLVVNFSDVNANHVTRYLPRTIISEKIVQWLDRAIVNGQATSGGAIFHGRVADFPFDEGLGKFEIRAHITDVELNYLSRWPPIHNLFGELIFSNRSMSLQGGSGKIFQSSVFDTSATIADMMAKTVLLKINGKVAGATQEKLQYLQVSPPLKVLFERSLTGLSVGGQSLLHLDLSIPLNGGLDDQVAIHGKVELKDNTFRMPGALGLIAQGINGTLHFTGTELQAQGATGRFFGRPATLDIKTMDSGKYSFAKCTIHGKLDPVEIARRFVPAWSQHFQGDADWVVELDIPLGHGGNVAKPILRIKSQLQDIAVSLPEPLGKMPGEELKLDVVIELAERERVIQLKYGGRLSAAMQFGASQDGFLLKRGELLIGEGNAVLPPLPGLRIVGGLDYFSYDVWKTLLTAELSPGPPGQKGSIETELGSLSNIDLQVKKLEGFGQTYHAAQITALRLGKEWELTVNSDELAGRIILPVDFTEAPLVMDLERWHLMPIKYGGDTTPDPRDLPALKINSKQFSYNKIDFGDVLLRISKQPMGLQLDRLLMNAPVTKITGSGAWTYDNMQHNTDINLTIQSKDIGATMSAMGYAGTIRGGKGRVVWRGGWPDSPGNFTPRFLQGSVNIHFEDGSLLDLEPGAGRIFGLLSLQALPRRLILDFRDLFAKGFTFDEIKGDFKIEGGDARTSNLRMSGPSTRIAVTGRVGLSDKDYDQLVTVIPDVASAAPLLGALVNPTAPVIIWVLKEIFQTQIDDAVGFQYTVTGSWDDPIIEKVEPEQPPEAEEFDDI